MERARQTFPTRLYHHRLGGQDGPSGLESAEGPDMALPPGVFRFRLGRDHGPARMTAAEMATELQDPFGRLVLAAEVFPLSLRSLLAAFDTLNGTPEGLPEQAVFLAADGGKIPWTPETNDVRREFRFVITRGRPAVRPPEIMIAASTVVDSEEIFLQLIAWDAVNQVYHFYQRLGQGWGWAGHSWDALAADTRGKGPFDSHINGSMVMKELKAPWIHWHSQASSITMDALAPDDPLRAEPLFLQRIGAQQLEQDVVRPGIRRWNDARFQASFKNGTLKAAPDFFRQVLETTTVNLACAPEDRSQVLPGRLIHLPLTFFFNSDALLDLLRIPAAVQRPELDAGIYAECLRRHEVSLVDGAFEFPGDTHFVFLVPESAFEDHVVLQKLLRLQILPVKLAAALLMVDFANPVFSPRRAALLRHVPAEITVAPGTPASSDVAQRMVDSIRAANAAPGSPEAEFLSLWDLAEEEWRPAMARLLQDYMLRVHEALRTFETFDPLFLLAESRRREFRRRPLAEFSLTSPVSNIPLGAPLLEMTPEGKVRPKG